MSRTSATSKGISQTALDLKRDKALSAYSLIANNTAITANGTAIVYKDLGEQVYSGTIVWTGTTAPSGTTTHTYQWTQIGKLVMLRINLKYTVAGTGVSAVSMTLPGDCPTPLVPSGFNTADYNLLYGTGALANLFTTGAATTGFVKLRNNSANNGFVIIVYGPSSTHIVAHATIQYWTT